MDTEIENTGIDMVDLLYRLEQSEAYFNRLVIALSRGDDINPDEYMVE